MTHPRTHACLHARTPRLVDSVQACESHYGPGRCVGGQCGDLHPLSGDAPAGLFSYYYFDEHASCVCDKDVGAYEWVYRNDGYTGEQLSGLAQRDREGCAGRLLAALRNLPCLPCCAM